MSLLSSGTSDNSPSTADEFESKPTCSILKHFTEEELEEIAIRLQHTVECEYYDHQICPVWFCHPMRLILTHTDHCERRRTEGCVLCSQVVEIVVHHGKSCHDDECLIPYCPDIRKCVEDEYGESDVDNIEHLAMMVVQRLRDEPSALDVHDFIYQHREKEAMLSDEMDWAAEVCEVDGTWDGAVEPERKMMVNLDWTPDDYVEYVRAKEMEDGEDGESEEEGSENEQEDEDEEDDNDNGQENKCRYSESEEEEDEEDEYPDPDQVERWEDFDCPEYYQ